MRNVIYAINITSSLGHLLRHLDCKLLIVWDGARIHRSRIVWDFVREQKGRLWLEFLPAYAPELNPVEYLWSQETARTTELLPTNVLAAEPLCPPSLASHAQTDHFGDWLLGAITTLLM